MSVFHSIFSHFQLHLKFYISLPRSVFHSIFSISAPSKIGCQFPSWIQKSWSTLDGSLTWNFAAPTNSTWINVTTVTSDNFMSQSYVTRKQSQVWCHKITESQTDFVKIILYKTEEW